jgi:hypothetical protein
MFELSIYEISKGTVMLHNKFKFDLLLDVHVRVYGVEYLLFVVLYLPYGASNRVTIGHRRQDDFSLTV